MKPSLVMPAALAIALCACNQQPSGNQATTDTAHITPAPAPGPDALPATASTSIAMAAGAPDAKAHKSKDHLTAEEIAQIKSTGKLGLWADQTAVCAKDVKSGLKTTLTWNVEGPSRVIIYVINNAGKEKRMGSGGPVGRIETGPWLRPGISFKLQAADTHQALGKVEIGNKAC